MKVSALRHSPVLHEQLRANWTNWTLRLILVILIGPAITLRHIKDNAKVNEVFESMISGEFVSSGLKRVQVLQT